MKLESYWLDTAPACTRAAEGDVAKPWFLPLVGAYTRMQDILH